MTSQLRSRLVLLSIIVLFLGSFAVASYLRFAGWTPERTKNYGELLQPPKDLSQLPLLHADGRPYAWAPETNHWRILVAPTPDCAQTCADTLDSLHRLWLSQGRKADRLEVLWFGRVPAGGPHFRNLIAMQPEPRLAAWLPEPARADALPVYLVDSSGFLVLRYDAGFEPAELRKDLSKLLK